MPLSPAKKLPRLLFLGTPKFAVKSLKALVESSAYEIVAVITQPDKPAGRGQKLAFPPVKEYALARGLTVLQPKSIKRLQSDQSLPAGSDDLKLQELLSTANFDSFIVVAYGQILPKSFFAIARCGAINVHGSVLPRWRGAAPIQRAVLAGDKTSGISIMQIEEGLDSGPVFSTEEVTLDQNETTGSLHDKLAEIGASLLIHTLPGILAGELAPQAQPSTGITHAAKWSKDETLINWNESAASIVRRIRANSPTPGARTTFRQSIIKVLRASVTKGLSYSAAPIGSVVDLNRVELIVASADGYVALEELQFPGKRPLSVSEILNGSKIEIGEIFQ